MRRYPKTTEIHGEIYQYEKILKDDFFSVNVLYKNSSGKRYVLKLSDFRFIFGKLLRGFAIWMSSHEYRIYLKVDGIPNIPKLGPRLGLRGYFHEFIEGRTLHELRIGIDKLPPDFFIKLRATLDAIHKKNIIYLDLDKRGNVILGDDGNPWLIDYQICQYFKPNRFFFAKTFTKLFNALKKEDLYHLYKQKKRYQKELITTNELKKVSKSRLLKSYNKYFGSWYRRLKRKIYPSGSNEIIWYKWKKNDKN